MNEKILETMMQENSNACSRAEDLVTYLYGEASGREAKDFERHMAKCAACRNELAAFRSVREGVVGWRDQSLPTFETSRAAMPALAEATVRKRSALAALREFFTLSPTWLRATTAMAVLAICALVVFTVVRFSESSKQVIVQTALTSPTKVQENKMSNQPVQEVRQDKNQQAGDSTPNKQPVVAARDNRSATGVRNRKSAGSSQMTAKNRSTPNKVNESRAVVREQLAELVQRPKEDDSLPRLSDLVDDSNESQ